jgi:hypothetical protein
MSTAQPQLAGPGGARTHPVVRRRRLEDVLVVSITALIAIAVALGVATAVPKPNLLITLGLLLGALGLLTLMVNSRLEVTVTILAVYLGCLDGPIKGFSGGGNLVAVLRNVLIAAVCAGALIRILTRREGVKLPPLSGWVIAFTALVLVEALNPNTNGTLKILGGFRQQLEWIPFFFFGYALIRSKGRLRKLFVVLSLIALANGIVSAYQTRLTPHQLASWGPGYAERVLGTGGASGTTYFSEGEGHVRPLALGSDIGFGGSVGVIALPGTLALLATARWRRRWLIPLLCMGALLAVATSLSRTAILGSIVTLLSFGVFSLSAGRQVIRPLAAMMVVLVLAVVLVTVLSSTEGSSAFSRYTSIAPEQVGTTAPSYKEISLKQIPNDIANDPFGFGLGTSGAASGFGGHTKVQLEGHGFSSETQYNFVMNELGLPGLILWVSFTIMLLSLAATRLRQIHDIETRIDLAAVFSVIAGLTFMGFAGAFMAGQGAGPFFWFAAGIVAYWLAGPESAVRSKMRRTTSRLGVA